ncbi:MAG: 30S ribosome-binding factor RbfA [Oscillospiraceae bacterium]|nr:30S ribosome-binding factor RbfA [Oscillospiraceae bacterium]
MSSNKIQRINGDISRVLSDRLRTIKDPRIQQGMLSVVAVDTTSDLRYCTVHISVLGECDERRLMKGLKSATGFLRRELGSVLTIRHTPELIFKLDKSMEHGAHVSKILQGLEVTLEETDHEQDLETDE